MARAFTPVRIEDLRAATQAIATELVDAMAAEGSPIDLVKAFAYPLPVRVICALPGVPPEDEAMFTHWSHGIARSVDPAVLRSAAIEDARAVASPATIFCRLSPPSMRTATASRRARS